MRLYYNNNKTNSKALQPLPPQLCDISVFVPELTWDYGTLAFGPKFTVCFLTYLPGIRGSAEARARSSGSSVRNVCPAAYTAVLRFSVGGILSSVLLMGLTNT